MRRKKRMAVLTAVVILIAIFSYGCAGTEQPEDSGFPETPETVSSQTVATNDLFSLEWDAEKACILLKQKETGKIWSTIPYDYYLSGETDEDMNSPIYIQYVDSVSLVSVVDKGFSDCVEKNSISSRKIENGIEIVYYFEGPGISVPVQYCLREDALVVSVDFGNAKEGANKLLSVSVAPFLCSAANSSEESYLVVPSGCGALMYLDEREEGTRTWSGEVYGQDPSRLLPESLMEDEAVRLPFFGIKDGENALLAVVEEGAGASVITANAGSREKGYSNAYVSFYARGFDVSEAKMAWAMSDVYRTEETIHVEKSVVAFYPMNGKDADYVGMAARYQEYLKDMGCLNEEAKEQPYALYITGGARVKELFLGVPVKKTRALTTFERVQEMLGELTGNIEQAPAVQLRGFGKSGLDPGKAAGGFDFGLVFGSNDDRLSLEEYCKEQGIPLYTDFDLVYFASGGEGLSTLLDAAKSASSHKVKLHYKNKALWHYEEDEPGYFLVKREKLQSLVDKLEETAGKKKISGISLSTLGQIAYSDYSGKQYSVRENMDSDVQKYLTQLREAGTGIAVQSANAYAAAVSDSVFEVTVSDGDYIALDAGIPLYQMVFKGYVSLYSTAVNTTEDYERSVMMAVSGGTSLGFSIIGDYDADFAETPYTGLNASSYAGNKSRLMETVAECADYYAAIRGQTITDYEFISESVTKTSFSNGTVIYVNHSDKTVESPLGDLKAYGFSYTLEEN